jgi:hypothetical protein
MKHQIIELIDAIDEHLRADGVHADLYTLNQLAEAAIGNDKSLDEVIADYMA